MILLNTSGSYYRGSIELFLEDEKMFRYRAKHSEEVIGFSYNHNALMEECNSGLFNKTEERRVI